MKINFLTLFPNFFVPFKTESIIKKAVEKNLIDINVVDLREFAINKHKQVDDTVYGGGPGMLLMVEPIDKALNTLGGKKILLSPQGKTFDQKMALELSKEKEITFIAGHYEGFDYRVRSLIDMELSIGDFVLTGGEIPAMAIADSIIRLVPGVIKEDSHQLDSFSNGLLESPQYTKPREYKNMKVPEVLLNGNHQEIEKWRKAESLKITKLKRSDLLKKMKGESNAS